MRRLLIIGSSGLARETYGIIKAINQIKRKWSFLGFVDENVGEKIIDDYSVIGNDDFILKNYRNIDIVFGIGSPKIREVLYDNYNKMNCYLFPNIIHPCVKGDFQNIQFGKANIIAANAIFSTQIKIGDCNVINMSTTIAHNVTIKNYCNINPGANVSGNVVIENSCQIGTNSVLHERITLKEGTILALGSTLTRDSKPYTTYLGCPAKKINSGV